MKVLLLSSHTPSLLWFRLDLMKAMQKAGCEVTAVGQMPEKDWEQKFSTIGVKYKQINFDRNGLNPLRDLSTLKDIKKLLKEENPNKIFAFQAKTISYGAIAAKNKGISDFYPMVGGLGSVFRGKGRVAKLIRAIMSVLYKQAFSKSKKVFVQNKDDKKVLIEAGLLSDNKIVLTRGSGVNLDTFAPVEFPIKPTFLYIGRLIRDKGVGEYLEACQKIKSIYGKKVRCLLVGPFDTNPSALKPDDLQPLISNGTIEYYGEKADVRPYIGMCSVYVLPSYHEGTPKTVLECMAMGRAIITTDAPGCRETVMDGENGYLVQVKNVDAVVNKMQYLVEHPEIALKMGEKSRTIAENIFDVHKVNEIILSTMGII